MIDGDTMLAQMGRNWQMFRVCAPSNYFLVSHTPYSYLRGEVEITRLIELIQSTRYPIETVPLWRIGSRQRKIVHCLGSHEAVIEGR